VVSNQNKDALIIDPGSDEKSIASFINKKNLNVKIILNTHAHYDHIGSVAFFKDKYSIPFCLHSKDEKLLNSANLYLKIFEGKDLIKVPTVDYYYDQVNIQDYIDYFSIKVFFTPGHSKGGVCLLIEDILFTGETLFNGLIGRVDLLGGDEKSLHNSLKIISKLKTSTVIFPGHGSSSTIGNELNNNEAFIQALQ
jgi:glyoxylase-like metal-dependent hydrolase (beta-lactamase superfamily II)